MNNNHLLPINYWNNQWQYLQHFNEYLLQHRAYPMVPMMMVNPYTMMQVPQHHWGVVRAPVMPAITMPEAGGSSAATPAALGQEGEFGPQLEASEHPAVNNINELIPLSTEDGEEIQGNLEDLVGLCVNPKKKDRSFWLIPKSPISFYITVMIAERGNESPEDIRGAIQWFHLSAEEKKVWENRFDEYQAEMDDADLADYLRSLNR